MRSMELASCNIITPPYAATAMVTGHITEVHSLLQFDLVKKNGICVWRCTVASAGTRGDTQLWPLHVRLHRSPGPKALLLPTVQRQEHFHSWCLSFINTEVGPLSEPLMGSPPPPRESERVKEEKLPCVQLASFQGSEPGWQVENSTL